MSHILMLSQNPISSNEDFMKDFIEYLLCAILILFLVGILVLLVQFFCPMMEEMKQDFLKLLYIFWIVPFTTV